MLVVIAKQKVLPGKSQCFIDKVAALAPQTRQCPGCISYELLQSGEDENTFIIHEVWAGEMEFAAHFETDFTKEFGATLDGIVDGPVEPYVCKAVV